MAIRMKQNGVWVDIKTTPDLDSSLSIEGKAADAKAVGDRFDKLPIATYEDSNNQYYTEILGLRSAKNIKVSKRENMVQVSFDLEDGEAIYNYFTLDDDGYPISISSNNITCNIDWEGI